MVTDRVIIGLNDYEKNQFAPVTRKELRDALLEVKARALLLSRVAGEELMKDDSSAAESLKNQLAEASSSLKGAQADNERAKGEILSLRKLVEDLGGEPIAEGTMLVGRGEGEEPKFPLYWTRSPARVTFWPRSGLSAEDSSSNNNIFSC